MSTVVTEVPTALKRLVRLVMRGFYNVEHAILMDMLIRNPCMKEDDLVELLKFERKQLRSVIAQLKNDRFVKVRLKMETGSDGKATRQNYYYINYKIFVNVLKYKLDHMRRKIETEERDSTSRASFKCTSCEKTFTDLEADQLCDFMTGEFRCSFCDAPVIEDESALPKTDSRLLLARFNEQIEPLYNLLREVDDIKLAPEILEPEPTDMTQIKRDASTNKTKNSYQATVTNENHTTWSGDATRNKSYDISNQGITINFGVDESSNAKNIQEKKEQPIWMVESTVKAEAKETSDYAWGHDAVSNFAVETNSSFAKQDDIMEALLAHERKGGAETKLVIPGHNSNDESSSESEDSSKPAQSFIEPEVGEMESDDDDHLMVTVGDQKYALTEVTEEIVAKMTPEEKEAYIRLTQDLYARLYE
ncbi:general transcription factor IIE subunit 1-like [Stegodyphus dumicola]|uniref:general transcription factor IIE subunit 1-like n=1 Tax=Stegodyphus dumicola TaxID=202533 RepID=UPI0015AA3A8D|nr:general transcription factor IIE subunit 1-like [Stegodyphus dumicola]